MISIRTQKNVRVGGEDDFHKMPLRFLPFRFVSKEPLPNVVEQLVLVVLGIEFSDGSTILQGM